MDAVDPALVTATETTLAAVTGVESVQQVWIRWVGPRLWAETNC